MKIKRISPGTGRADLIAKYEDITEHTAHEFLVGFAQKEADQLSGTVSVKEDIVQGLRYLTATVKNEEGEIVATYVEQW